MVPFVEMGGSERFTEQATDERVVYIVSNSIPCFISGLRHLPILPTNSVPISFNA